MFCPNCGKEVKEEIKFCQYCGSQIVEKQENYIDTFLKNTHKKIAMIGVVALVIIIGIVVLFSDKQKEQEVLVDEGLLETKSENVEWSDTHEERIELSDTPKEDLSQPEKESNDIHSFWIDGTEFKILKYLDEENMLVKFPLDNHLVQAIVPRTLETENYVREYYCDSYNEEDEGWIKLINCNKEEAVMFEYMHGPETMLLLEERCAELYEQKGSEGIFEVESLRNGKALVVEGGQEVACNEYDIDERWLDGYMVILLDKEEQTALVMLSLNEDVQKINIHNFEHVAFRKIEEDDYVMRFGYWQENYETVMDNAYQKYREIIEDPTTYLQNNYDEPGDNYNLHYLYDLSGDNVPEMIFMGQPRRMAIVGDKNAISLSCDQIVFSDIPNIFYTSIAFQGDVTWEKYEIQTDVQGYLVANKIAGFGTYMEETFWYNEEDITADEYAKLMAEIDKTDRPKPRLYDTDEYIASKKGFQRSVQCLNNNFVFENY